jgi:hypothetical protein
MIAAAAAASKNPHDTLCQILMTTYDALCYNIRIWRESADAAWRQEEPEHEHTFSGHLS